jgi:hypothetical protein
VVGYGEDPKHLAVWTTEDAAHRASGSGPVCGDKGKIRAAYLPLGET